MPNGDAISTRTPSAGAPVPRSPSAEGRGGAGGAAGISLPFLDANRRPSGGPAGFTAAPATTPGAVAAAAAPPPRRTGSRGVLAMLRAAADPHPGPAAAPGPATPVRKKPSFDFSVTGLVYCSMMMFMGLAAINSQANLLFAVFGLMIGILLISGVVCRLVLSRVGVTRSLPEFSVVGQPTIMQYEFLNRKKFWPSLSLCVAELDGAEAFVRQPQAYMLHAAPGMTAVVPVTVVPKRRGLHELNLFQLSTSFPFGFIKRAMERARKEPILIYPAIGHVSPRLLAMCRSAERSGSSMKPRRGGQDEFYGVKEYRTGENPRWIHWKRTARTGRLVSKEMTQVSPPRLMILVDTFLRNRTPAEHAAVERSIAMAASLASRALESGMAVGLAAWNGKAGRAADADDQWILVPAQRGKRHTRDVLAALARLPLNTAVDAAALLDHARILLKHGVTPVVFTPGDVQLGLVDQLRGGAVVIPARSAQADAWFQFDPKIQFDRCMPADQQPDVHPARKAPAPESKKKQKATAVPPAAPPVGGAERLSSSTG